MTLCEREIFDGSKKLSTMYLDIPPKIFKYNSYRVTECTLRDNLVYLAESIVNGLSHTYINNMFQYCASKKITYSINSKS